MRAHEKAALALKANDITFKNGLMLPESELIDSGIIGSSDYKQAKNVKSGQPNSALDLGKGLLTFNDTDYIFPYSRDHFWDNGDLLGPADILRNAYRARKAAEMIESQRDQKEEIVDVQRKALREAFGSSNGIGLDDSERPEEVNERISELHDEKMDVLDTYHRRKHALLNQRISRDGEYEAGYVFPFGRIASPHPDRVEHNYDTEWSQGSLNDIPEFSDFEQVKKLLNEGQGVDWLTIFAETDSGRIHCFSEDMNEGEGRMNRKYREIGLILSENDITLSNGKYVTEDELKELELIDSGRYRQAWDLIYGRSDSVLHLGNGMITLNDTDFSIPWDEQNYYAEEFADITSYSNEGFETAELESGLSMNPENLIPPLELLKKSWMLSKEALEMLESGDIEGVENLVRDGAKNDDFNEEPRFDQEPLPEAGEVDPNRFSSSWEEGSIDNLPDLNDHEGFLRTVADLSPINDVVFKFRGGRNLAESSISDPRLEVEGEEVMKVLERQNVTNSEERLKE